MLAFQTARKSANPDGLMTVDITETHVPDGIITFIHSDGITYRVERVRTGLMRRETTAGAIVPGSQCLYEHSITAVRYDELHTPAAEIEIGVRRGDISRVLGDQAVANLPKGLV